MFFFNIILKKVKNDLVYRKLQDVAKLIIINLITLAAKLKTIFTIAFNKNDYISKISNKVKLLAFQFTSLF